MNQEESNCNLHIINKAAAMASEKRKVLVTGGAGFIGSHCLIELIKDGYEPLVADDYSNSCFECIARVEKIVGQHIDVVELDVNNLAALDELFAKHSFFAVLHLAAFKSVGESVAKPIKYYQTNVNGTLNVLHVSNNTANSFLSSYFIYFLYFSIIFKPF